MILLVLLLLLLIPVMMHSAAYVVDITIFNVAHYRLLIQNNDDIPMRMHRGQVIANISQ